MQISGSLYDRLKFLAQVLLPAVGALYFALAGIWGLPAADKVVGSITVIDTFIGVCLQISTSQYKQALDGHVAVDQETGQARVALDTDAVLDKETVTLKVAK